MVWIHRVILLDTTTLETVPGLTQRAMAVSTQFIESACEDAVESGSRLQDLEIHSFFSNQDYAFAAYQ